MKATDYSKQCQFCKHYHESFDDFGHLEMPRCTERGIYTQYDCTCNKFEHSDQDYANSFYTDINDDD